MRLSAHPELKTVKEALNSNIGVQLTKRLKIP
jgi:hypothetical protein